MIGEVEANSYKKTNTVEENFISLMNWKFWMFPGKYFFKKYKSYANQKSQQPSLEPNVISTQKQLEKKTKQNKTK